MHLLHEKLLAAFNKSFLRGDPCWYNPYHINKGFFQKRQKENIPWPKRQLHFMFSFVNAQVKK